MTGRVFLRWSDVRRFLAGRLFRAPDAEQVVVELEREPERPAEAAVAGDDLLVRRWPARAPASIEAAMRAAVLRPIMSK